MKAILTIMAVLLLASMAGKLEALDLPTTIKDGAEHVYGANIGWINARVGSMPGKGLAVSEHVCSGYLFSANVGWIHMGSGAPANGVAYQNDNAGDYGVNVVGDGRLDGFAYGANIGWIKFDQDASSPAKYDLLTGKLSGYAYSANVGWINLGESSASIDAALAYVADAPDSDSDGIADFWELKNSGLSLGEGGLDVYSATSDADGDGQPDRAEYQGNTDPDSPSSTLQIIGYQPVNGYSQVELTFTSSSARLYRVQSLTDLGDPPTNLGPGPFPGGANSTTAVVDVVSVELSRYWKIVAIRPLPPPSP